MKYFILIATVLLFLSGCGGSSSTECHPDGEGTVRLKPNGAIYAATGTCKECH